MLVFGIKIPMTKHEIMLHAMSLKDQGRQRTAFTYPDSLGQIGSAHYQHASQAMAHASLCVCLSERRTL